MNRLEYYLSRLERLVEGSDLLPRSAETLPSAFESALLRIRQQVRQSSTQVHTGNGRGRRCCQDNGRGNLVRGRYGSPENMVSNYLSAAARLATH